ncbi:MAG: TIGR03087 family PEP-CTERM/XrtA system glycosyltransferase [Sphingomonadales bacterium]
MADILFLAHRIPYPPNKGDKIRSWNLLRVLARDHQVRLGCFIDDADDWAHVAVLRQLCAECHFVPLGPRWAKLRALRGLAMGQALSLPYYSDRRMRQWVAAQGQSGGIDVAIGFSSVMGQYLLDFPARRIMDFVDIDSDKWRQYAQTAGWPMRLVYGREARRLLAFERTVASAFDASLFVSAAEAAMFRRLAPAAAEKIQALENGVDTDFFDPGADFKRLTGADAPTVVFTGAMDYWANVDAVIWFAEAVWPRVREHHAQARFYIVGGKPTAAVKALDGRAGVVVTGRVDDVRPFIAAAGVAVAPMRIARGVQNKVLEAMAMAKPVVTTPQGLEGLAAIPDRHLKLAANAEVFAQAVCGLLAQPSQAQALGLAARAQILARYGWSATLAPLSSMLTLWQDKHC